MTSRVLLLCVLVLIGTVPLQAQKVTISGKLTGEVAKMVKEVQFVCDGKMQKLTVNKEDHTFSGDIKLREPQFVEINSGNPKPQAYYMVPNEKLSLTIDKPSLQGSHVVFAGSRSSRLQEIFNLYYKTLDENGVNTGARDWQQLLFPDNTPLLVAERKVEAELQRQASLVNTVPNFRKDIRFFMKCFRKYTTLDDLTLTDLEKMLEEVRATPLKTSSATIPFFREYLTDLTNAYAARTLLKYGVSYDASKQRHLSQFIAAEAIEKYITNPTIRSYLYSEKLKVELPTNGLKNEAFVNFLFEHSEQFVRDTYQEKIDLLRANKAPDLNAPRKKAFSFLLHDSTGKEYRLSDFRGKMIFVDFWASWCAPCKAQIPYQKELEKLYAGKDIVFLGVSLDRSKEAWLKAVKEEDLHGYILHAEGNFKNEFPAAYGIESIPRYMLIDAEGNMISDNMMKPQNKKEIMGIIDEELYAKNTAAILDKHFQAIGADSLRVNGLKLRSRQSVLTMNAFNQIWYRYPNQLRIQTQMEETEQMRLIVGKEFFRETLTLMNGDQFMTTNPANTAVRNNWMGRLAGFELFLHKSINNAAIKFAEDNASGSDSCYILKLLHNGNTEKYYINKKTYLIDKVVLLTGNQLPRKGGGFFESAVLYEDYRNINGVMIPYKINQSNIVTIKIENAEVGPLAESLFQVK